MKYIGAIALFSVSVVAFGQNNIQSLKAAGFRVACPCTLVENTNFIKMIKSQGNEILGAYICLENKDNPEYVAITNININDLSDSYTSLLPSTYSHFEKQFLESYASQLATSGLDYKNITYKGVPALEYSFEQMGIPTKAIIFLKEKKSILIQVGSRHDLITKFNALKFSLEIMN